MGKLRKKLCGENEIGYKFGRKGSIFKDREARFMEKATEMKALESLCLYGKKQLILLLGSIQGIEDHKSSYCGGP